MVRLLYMLLMIGHICVQVVMGEGVFSYDCDAVNTRITITYVNEAGTTATRFYATGKENTCSTTSTITGVAITGNGASATPYTLTVNPATTPATTPMVVAQYTCDNQKRLHFHYFSVISTPADIYSVDKRATCSMSGDSGTGTATPTDPFQLIIDVSGTQTPDCGATEVSTDVYEVNILVQSTALILKADDVIYRVRCNFSEVPTELSSLDTLSVKTELKNGSVTNLIGNASLRVMDEDGNPITQIRLGQSITLQADLVTTDAAALHVSNCVARPARDSTVEVTLLNESGCSTGDLISSFSSSSELSRAKTETFLAFRFDNSDSLVFICMVDFCYGTDITRCTGNHCSDERRKKRGIINGDEEQVSTTIVLFSDYRPTAALGRNATLSEDSAIECNEHLYWTVLGCLLGIILLLLVATCSGFFYCICFRRRKDQ